MKKKKLTKEENVEQKQERKQCNAKTEVYSRVVGFYRPVQQWNEGKTEEFKDRTEYLINAN